MRFRRWEARGVWPRLWKNLHVEPLAGACGLLLDWTTVRAHRHAAGAPKKRWRPGFGPPARGLGAPKSTRPPSENGAVALHLTVGQAHDGRQCEALYESLPADNVLKFAALDKGEDADCIRERLAADGIQAVIPPISSRSTKLTYDKELSRGRNRVERLFHKLKPFRYLATRSDKQAKTFFAAVCLVAAFLIIRNS